MKPSVRIHFDPTPAPRPGPRALREHAIATTQRWLDELGRAPTAEEVLAYAEAYAGEWSGPRSLTDT